MTSDRLRRRLISALADATPAFTPTPTSYEESRSRRLLSALADSTPAFHPQGGADAATSVAADSPTSTDDQRPQPTAAEVPVPEPALAVFADNLASLSPTERIAIRAWFPANTLENVRTVAEFAASAAELVLEFDVDVTRTRNRATELAGHLARDFSIEVTIARDRVLDATLARDRVSNIAGQLSDEISRAQILSRALTLADSSISNLANAHSLDRTLAYAQTIVLAVASENDLDLDLVPAGSYTIKIGGEISHTFGDASYDPPPARVPDMDTARSRATDRDRQLSRDLANAIISDRDSARELVNALEQDHDSAADRAAFSASLAAAIDRLLEVLADMTGADLRSVDLSGIPLTGIRWSTMTQWPPAWEEQVRRDSVELADSQDVYEIRPGGIRVDALLPR